MKAKEFVQRHKKLEADISHAVNSLITEYQNEVGLGVQDVVIDSQEVTAMGDDFRKFVMSASAKLDLSEV